MHNVPIPGEVGVGGGVGSGEDSGDVSWAGTGTGEVEGVVKRLEDWPDVLKEGEVGSESLSSSSISLGSIQGVFQKCILSSFVTLKEKTHF